MKLDTEITTCTDAYCKESAVQKALTELWALDSDSEYLFSQSLDSAVYCFL
jgi:hypothetical protein